MTEEDQPTEDIDYEKLCHIVNKHFYGVSSRLATEKRYTDEMHALLVTIEWNGAVQEKDVCPCCFENNRDGHNFACALKRLIGDS